MKGYKGMPTLGATNRQLENRVAALEAWQAIAKQQIAALQVGGSPDLTALTARVTKLEQTPCGQQAVIDNHESRLDVLDADHIPA